MKVFVIVNPKGWVLEFTARLMARDARTTIQSDLETPWDVLYTEGHRCKPFDLVEIKRKRK